MSLSAPADASADAGVLLSVDGRAIAVHDRSMMLACCSLEVASAFDLPPVAGPVDLHVLVISGTATPATAPWIEAAYRALPEPRRVVAVGACLASGGPYWDSPAVTPGIDDLIAVDLIVPGCPPRPQAIVEAVASLVRLLP